MQTKSQLLIIALMITIVSCDNRLTKNQIRSIVVNKYSNVEISPYNGFLRHFATCYFRYPDDIDEFIDFLRMKKIHEPEYSFFEQSDSCDYINELSRHRVLYASFRDSVFYVIPSIDAGSSVIGTPQFWQENTGAYPEINYRPRFAISGFDSEDKYVFKDYELLRSRFESVRKKYSNFILRSGASIEPFSRKVYDSLVYLNLIYAYDVDNDSFSFSEMVHIPAPDSLFSTRGTVADASPLNLEDKSIEEYCEKYLYDIQVEVKLFLEDKKTIRQMLMVIPICF